MDRFFMAAALSEARSALAAGEFPVGCVVVSEHRIVARGARQGSSLQSANEIDHAEMVAIRQLSGPSQKVETGSLTLYSTMEPCLMCFAAIMLAGIGRVVYAYEDVMGGATQIERNLFPPLYRDGSITVVPAVLREESLALFKQFFQNPENPYWRGSLLCTYTLGQ